MTLGKTHGYLNDRSRWDRHIHTSAVFCMRTTWWQTNGFWKDAPADTMTVFCWECGACLKRLIWYDWRKTVSVMPVVRVVHMAEYCYPKNRKCAASALRRSSDLPTIWLAGHRFQRWRMRIIAWLSYALAAILFLPLSLQCVLKSSHICYKYGVKDTEHLPSVVAFVIAFSGLTIALCG